MGRRWRARLSSSSIAWLTSRFSSATSPARARRGVLGERLEPQQDRSQGLVDLVVQVTRQPAALLLLGAHRRVCRSGGAPPRCGRAGAGRSARAGRSRRRLGLGERSRRRARPGRSARRGRSAARAGGSGAAASRGSRTASGRSTARGSRTTSAGARRSGRGPAARLAANSVSATSTTFAATTWPMRESSRRVTFGLMDRSDRHSGQMGSPPHIGRRGPGRKSW